MSFHAKACTAILLALTLGACSNSPQTPHRDAAVPVSTSANAHTASGASSGHTGSGGAITMQEGPANQQAQHPRSKTYLHDLMKQSAFEKAFHAMDGSDDLPGWIAQGGTATPAEKATVDGESLLLAQACKPHSCPSQRILLLYDAGNTSMQGLFVDDPAPGVDNHPSDKARFTWLGHPDDATRRWLRGRLTSR